MPDALEVGVRLRQAAPLVRLTKALFVASFDLVDPDQALPDPEGVTVYLSNHGPVVGPLPAPALTVDYLLSQKRYDGMVAATLFHRVVEYVPGLSPLFHRYFGHSKRRAVTMAQLTTWMKERRIQILGTVPEGRSCAFTYDEPVGPFTKFGLMAAALKTDANIVLTAQKGVEAYGVPVRLPHGATLPLPGRPRGLLVPWWDPGRRAHIIVKYKRFQPSMSADERASLPPERRRESLGREFSRIREELIALYRSIDGESSG